MADWVKAQKAANTLADAIEEGIVTGPGLDCAQALLSRLLSPVRVTFLGLGGAGKSGLLNLFAGQTIVPEGAPFPSLQLMYGETEQTTCVFADGTTKTLDHCDAAKIRNLSPSLVQMVRPLPTLENFTLTEVVLGDKSADQTRSLKWVAGHTDIVLWCTQTFSDIEKAMWQDMPDHLKAHAILVLTQKEKMTSEEDVQLALDHLDDRAENMFYDVLPISSKAAFSACGRDGAVDMDAMRFCGAVDLVATVSRLIGAAHQDIFAQTEALLRPKSEVSAPVAAAPDEAVDQLTGLKPHTREAYLFAVDHLSAEALEISTSFRTHSDPNPQDVMARSVENVLWLSDYLSDHGDDSDPSLVRTRDTVLDAADLIQLLQMERRDASVVEAVSLVIQLKRDLEADLAA
ncbi:MAG: hypothetical protein WBC93_02720 [Sulfitobacter sp.]